MEPTPENQAEEQEESGGGSVNLDVVRSYLTFAKTAIGAHKIVVALTAIIGIALTVVVARYLPRTYLCETAMMTVSSGVLDSDRGPQPLAGAEGMIMSHESLERLINEVGLKKKYRERRPPLMALKDQVIASIFGPMDDKTLTTVLIGTLGTKIATKVDKDTLTIDVEWTDSKTAAELAEAAREIFLRSRHTAEMSAFQDKMGILDSHAIALRKEIADLAQQMKESIAAKRAELEAEVKAKGDKPSATSARVAVVTRATRRAQPDEQLSELQQRLATLKQTLATAETDRSNRMRDEQAKLNDLMVRLTPNHPQVIAQQGRVAVASQVSSELALARSEVQDLESQIRQREAMQQQQRPGSSGTVAALSEPAGGEPLPREILGLLDERDADPALAAQISGAVVRYGSLRDDIRGAKLALDTAQAAFSRRYQVTLPAEEPTAPTKPKKPVIIGAGAVLSLLLALLLPILMEIRRDLVVERWQVTHLQLPVLGELRLPPNSGEGGG